MLKIKLFGVLAEKLETESLFIESCPNVESLKRNLLLSHPNLNSLSFKVAVNRELATDNLSLNEADEIALLPPFSGG